MLFCFKRVAALISLDMLTIFCLLKKIHANQTSNYVLPILAFFYFSATVTFSSILPALQWHSQIGHLTSRPKENMKFRFLNLQWNKKQPKNIYRVQSFNIAIAIAVANLFQSVTMPHKLQMEVTSELLCMWLTLQIYFWTKLHP